ncbi:MAG: D-alanyl-D-alanine carboxypeptidase [Firmicutes bacterium]|nr:D-alanyl-D-alanine carboxypeptidase [Bacillota bacterium]
MLTALAALACAVQLVARSPVASAASAPTAELAPSARAAVLMDAGTGTVLYERNAQARLPLASVTKVATMLVIFDALHKGQVRLSDPVRTSEHAASMGGSQIFLKPGEVMPLRDFIKAIAVASANDAAVAAAEHVAGSEPAFVARMNARVRVLGLHNTHFANTNGLPVPDHYASAYDLAVLSRELLKYPEVTQFTGVYSDYVRSGSANPFWLVNTNRLVRFYGGMDGLKTGFTAQARYCLAATAKRGGLRMIAVVLGEPTSKLRNAEVAGMMDYAFAHYELRVLHKTESVVALCPISRGALTAVGVRPQRPVGVLQRKGAPDVAVSQHIALFPLSAPVKKGQVGGYLEWSAADQSGRVPLVAIADVRRASGVEMLGRAIANVLLLGVNR